MGVWGWLTGCVCVCVGLLQFGVTALMVASREGHEACVKLLLDKGAQVDLQGKVCCG